MHRGYIFGPSSQELPPLIWCMSAWIMALNSQHSIRKQPVSSSALLPHFAILAPFLTDPFRSSSFYFQLPFSEQFHLKLNPPPSVYHLNYPFSQLHHSPLFSTSNKPLAHCSISTILSHSSITVHLFPLLSALLRTVPSQPSFLKVPSQSCSLHFHQRSPS